MRLQVLVLIFLLPNFILIGCSGRLLEVSVPAYHKPDVPTELMIASPSRPLHTDNTIELIVVGAEEGDTINIYDDADCTNLRATDTAKAGYLENRFKLDGFSLGGRYELFTTVINETTNESPCLTSVKYVTCPDGYIPVDGLSQFGVDNFCIMAHEASDDGNGYPVSDESLPPWVNITLEEAKKACNSLNFHLGDGVTYFSLVSNAEWMNIAYIAEQNYLNWSGGDVAQGCLYSGNNGVDSDCSYNGDDPEFGSTEARN